MKLSHNILVLTQASLNPLQLEGGFDLSDERLFRIYFNQDALPACPGHTCWGPLPPRLRVSVFAHLALCSARLKVKTLTKTNILTDN